MKTLNELARELYLAKQEEAKAKDLRIAAEEAIAALVPIEGDSGTKTVDAGDGLKITVERKLNYKVDVDGIRGLNLETPPLTIIPASPASYAFDKKAYEKLRKDAPVAAGLLAAFVTVTPAKVAVTLKL